MLYMLYWNIFLGFIFQTTTEKKHLLPSLTLYSSKTATKIDTERAAFSLLGFILQKHSFMQKKKQKNGNLRVIYDHKKYYRVDLET